VFFRTFIILFLIINIQDFIVFKFLLSFLFLYFRFYITLWYFLATFFYFLDFNYLFDLTLFLAFFILYFNFSVLFYNGELFYLNIYNFFIIFWGLFFSLFLVLLASPFYVCSFLYIGSGLVFVIRFLLCSLEIGSMYSRLLSLLLRLLCNLLSLHLLTHLLFDFFWFCFYILFIFIEFNLIIFIGICLASFMIDMFSVILHIFLFTFLCSVYLRDFLFL
jgi:hypothetical protein